MDADFDDALDIEAPGALEAYLRERGYIEADERIETKKLTGGVSNRTMLVTRPSGEQWVVKQALEQLRVDVEWHCSPQRIEREALALRWLRRLAPLGAVVEIEFEDPLYHLLGMQAVPQPHENWKQLLLAGEIEQAHVEQFGRLLGTIHRAAYERRETLALRFADWRYFEALRLEPYYAYTAGQLSECATFLRDLIDDTRRNRLTLVHGDYSPKNVLVYRGSLVLLDHEVAHFGDPAFDVGFGLAHLASKASALVTHRDRLLAAGVTFWNSYWAEVASLPWAEELEPRAVRHTLACMLARVAGRSPLEYFDRQARELQREFVTSQITRPPRVVSRLLGRWADRLAGHESD